MPVCVLITAEFSPEPALEAMWLDELPTQRRDQLSTKEPRARHRSLLATRLLAAALRRAGHPPSLLATLQQPPRSQPTLAAPLHFSLSHCDGRVVCALSTDGPVGVDVEALAGVKAAEFTRYLGAEERAWAGLSARRFLSVWTRKEAVVKAAGSAGLAAVPTVETAPAGQVATLAGRTWHTVALPVGRAHLGHLALADHGSPLRIERVRRAELEAL